MLKDKEFTKVQKISGFSLWMLLLTRIAVARVLQEALVKLRNLAGEVTRVASQISDNNDILAGLTELQAAMTAVRTAKYQIQSLSAITGRFKLRRYNVGE
ncbi:hypothetical protein [Pantoea agglomerans]|uniref:hypothetical protein n=2 Tax=Enterobacter agglomerans TaxID=549 RepID=UPI00045CBCD1|nr:hypothetical protein T296_17570 [Pantoea agglomerans Eh318]